MKQLCLKATQTAITKPVTVKNKVLDVYKRLGRKFHVYDLVDPVVKYFQHFSKRPTHGTITRALRKLRKEGNVDYEYLSKQRKYKKNTMSSSSLFLRGMNG